MLFNITFLLFVTFARITTINGISQELILHNNETRDLRFKSIRRFVNSKNFGKIMKAAKVVAKVGVSMHPALKGISTGINVAQKLMEARAKLKKLDALKKSAKSLKNIKNLKSKINKVKSTISKDKRLIANSKKINIKKTKSLSKSKVETFSKGKSKSKSLSRGKNKSKPNSFSNGKRKVKTFSKGKS
jgi:hypothetical protein